MELLSVSKKQYKYTLNKYNTVFKSIMNMLYGVKNNKHLKVQCQNWPTFGYYVLLLDFNGSVYQNNTS